jgi:hypothetical protein
VDTFTSLLNLLLRLRYGRYLGRFRVVDTDQDRHVSFKAAIAAIQSEEDYPEGPVERVELVCHASGEVTWRVWTPRAEEPVGGYIPAEQLR